MLHPDYNKKNLANTAALLFLESGIADHRARIKPGPMLLSPFLESVQKLPPTLRLDRKVGGIERGPTLPPSYFQSHAWLGTSEGSENINWTEKRWNFHFSETIRREKENSKWIFMILPKARNSNPIKDSSYCNLWRLKLKKK